MIIPKKNAALIKTYQKSLFHNKDTPKSDRIYAFYLLLKPILLWLRKELPKYNLEEDEIESELYLFCAKLFNKFNPEKSSIIPYLEKYIPWFAGHLVYNLKKTIIPEIPSGLIRQKEDTYELQEEYYWHPEKILFEDRYVGNSFTRAEKYIISIVLANESELTQNGLARLCGLNRITIINKLKELSQLEEFKQ